MSSRAREIGKRVLPPKVLFWLRSIRERYWDAQRFGEIYNKYTSEIPSFPSRLSSPKRLVLFYPETPVEDSVTYKLCALLGYGITNVPDRNFDIAFKRRDDTRFNPDELSPLSDDLPVINRGSIDISKRHVNQVFEDVFEYKLGVDPCTYRGEVVAKSNVNAAHDGRIFECPISSSKVLEEMVYQKAIDNTTRDGMVVDYRVPVHGEKIPLIYLKYRPYETRFSNRNSYVYIAEPEVIFTDDELQNIISFASKMGIDFGEFDILRDNKDDRMYIVDANNTPFGPPNGLTGFQELEALHRMAASFKNLLNQFDKKGHGSQDSVPASEL